MQAIEIKRLNDGKLYYPMEGCHIYGSGKIAGIFNTVEDAIQGDGYEDSTLAWDSLTAEEQAIAKANSEDLERIINGMSK